MTGSFSIALVVPAFDKGGLEQVVFNLYSVYRAAGFSCQILVEKNECGYLSSLVDPADLFIFNLDEQLFLTKCIQRDVRVLHYHYSVFGLEGAVYLGIHTIYTIHNVYTWLTDREFEERADKILRAHRVVAVSAFVKRYFCQRAGRGLGQVEVIPNGINIESLRAAPRHFTQCKRQAGRPDHQFVFANVASFHRVKHQAVIVGAVERLAINHRDFHIILVGNIGDQSYFAEVQAIIRESPARDFFSVMEYMDRDEISSFYEHVMDCLLLPSIQEGCSNVVLECIAFNKPMIVTDVGNSREAAYLHPQVRVIPPARQVQELDPKEIESLSREKEASNVAELARAMEEVMGTREWPPGALSKADLDETIGIKSMAAKYLTTIEAEYNALNVTRSLTP